MYENNRSKDPEEQEAFAEELANARKGDATARYWVGFRYQTGYGIPIDHVSAAFWYEKAAQQGHAESQVSLGDMYHMGQGVAQDDQAAQCWYEKAIDQGNKNAEAKLHMLSKMGKTFLPSDPLWEHKRSGSPDSQEKARSVKRPHT